jgi:serine/threonine protein kinase
LCYRTDQWEIARNSLIIETEKLGNGAFAYVYKGTIIGQAPAFSIYKTMSFEQDHNNYVAIKVLRPDADSASQTDFLNEIEFMKALGYHAHIISMLGYVNDAEQPMLILEYCSLGDMLQFLRKHKNAVQLQVRYTFTYLNDKVSKICSLLQ